jgi:hypothetical protein
MTSIMHGDDFKTISLFSYILFSLLNSHCLSLSPSSISLLPSSSFSFLMSYFIVINFYLKSSLFWDREPCCPTNINRCVRGKCRLQLQGWRWRRHVPLKLRFNFTGLQGVISQKIEFFTTTMWQSQILQHLLFSTFLLPFPLIIFIIHLFLLPLSAAWHSSSSSHPDSSRDCSSRSLLSSGVRRQGLYSQWSAFFFT